MKVTVFGIGYVGLVQAAVLAEVGHDVVCVDVDKKKVEDLKRGEIPIYEPGLESLVRNNYEAGRLSFTTDAKEGVDHGQFQFIAVGTPPDEDGAADLKYVLKVAATIADNMKFTENYSSDVDQSKIIVNKSTVPVGTADRVTNKVQEVLNTRFDYLRSVDIQLPLEFPAFQVASNPEFLKEGAAVADCMKPDRIIIGTDDEMTREKFRELYAPFSRNHDRMLFMDVRSAELTKYAANCMLATKISFMNEMACLAELLGADIEAVRQGIGSDPRIGYHFIYPGCGYGGSCFPKDVQALKRSAEGINFDPLMLRAVEERNNLQKQVLFDKVDHYFNGDLSGKTFALWGLSFKPNTDDMRDAPSRVLMEALWQSGANIQAYDPEAMEEAKCIYGVRKNLSLCSTSHSALQGADALLICTEWTLFRAPDFSELHKLLKRPVIFDGRNMYEPERMKQKGFTYISIGR